MLIEKGYGFDDVLIKPVFSNVESREDPVLNTEWVKGILAAHPVVPANMDCIATLDLARSWDGPFIHHRFQDISLISSESFITKGLKDFNGIEVKRLDWEHDVEKIIDKGIGICIDIAHAHTKSVYKAIDFIKSRGGRLIVGNIATADAARDLCNEGVDALKVGIGPGAACTTRLVTGVGVPQITAIMECADTADKYHVPIIADGGIRNSGDIAKAIAAGANSVMIGSLFAGSDEAGGKEGPCPQGNEPGKEYWGQSSEDFQKEWYGGMKAGIVAEGITMRVPKSGPAKDTLISLCAGLKSSMSYLGAHTIPEFQSKARFIEARDIYR